MEIRSRPQVGRRIWDLCILLTVAWAVCVRANVDMGGFGPMLCPLDEAGQAEVQAAQQVSQGWPTLNIRSNPEETFALVPTELQDPNVTSISRAGAWLRLKLDPTTFDSSRNSPRDRTLRRIKWYFTQRYTIRASTPANVPVYLDLQLLNPSLMLRASSSEPGAVSVADTTFEGHASEHGETSTEVRPEEGFPPDELPQHRPNNYYATHHAHERTQMHLRKQESLRTPTQPSKHATEAPCRVVYLHIVPHSPAIPIPARPCTTKRPWQHLLRPWDKLAWDGDRSCESSFVTAVHDGFAGAPVTVKLEKLDLGSVPRTAMGLMGTVLVSLVFARGIAVWAQRAFARLSVLAWEEVNVPRTNQDQPKCDEPKVDEHVEPNTIPVQQ